MSAADDDLAVTTEDQADAGYAELERIETDLASSLRAAGRAGDAETFEWYVALSLRLRDHEDNQRQLRDHEDNQRHERLARLERRMARIETIAEMLASASKGRRLSV